MRSLYIFENGIVLWKGNNIFFELFAFGRQRVHYAYWSHSTLYFFELLPILNMKRYFYFQTRMCLERGFHILFFEQAFGIYLGKIVHCAYNDLVNT